MYARRLTAAPHASDPRGHGFVIHTPSTWLTLLPASLDHTSTETLTAVFKHSSSRRQMAAVQLGDSQQVLRDGTSGWRASSASAQPLLQPSLRQPRRHKLGVLPPPCRPPRCRSFAARKPSRLRRTRAPSTVLSPGPSTRRRRQQRPPAR